MRCGLFSALTLLVLLCSACFNTRILFGHSSKVQISHDWDETWYHDAVFGLAELSGPIKLDEACPDGAAYAEQRQSFLNGLVERITHNLYNPQTVTVYCKQSNGQKPDLKTPLSGNNQSIKR